MKSTNWGKLPFEELRLVYFKAYDKEHVLPFFDSTDKQILDFLVKIHETAHIIRIELVEVLDVKTYKPKEFKLEISELKASLETEERIKRDERIKKIKDKFEEK